VVRPRLRTRGPEAPLTETLATKLAELEPERARSAAESEAFTATIEDRLREIDGAEALGEITAEQAAKDRGDVFAEKDSIVARAESARRAVEHIQARVIEAADAEAEALKIEPLAEYRAAIAARDAAAAVLAEREEDVALKRANCDAAEEAARAVLVRYDPKERERDREERSRRKTAVEWAVRQVGSAGLLQLPESYRDEARQLIAQRDAEAREATRAAEAAREFPRAEVRQAEPGDWPRIAS